MTIESKIEDKIKRLNSWIEYCEKELVKIDQCIKHQSGYCEVRFLFPLSGNQIGWCSEKIYEDIFFEPKELIFIYKSKVEKKKEELELDRNELILELKKELIK